MAFTEPILYTVETFLYICIMLLKFQRVEGKGAKGREMEDGVYIIRQFLLKKYAFWA